jgi:hypothetical protein
VTNTLRLIFLCVSVLFVKCDDSKVNTRPNSQLKSLASEARVPSGIYKLRRYKPAMGGYLIPFPCHFQRMIKGDKDLSKGLVF